MVVDKGRSAVVTDHGHDARFESHVPEEKWRPPYAIRDYTREVGAEVCSGLADILPTFARCIIQNEPVPVGAFDGARATRFILRCFESARTGRIIPFD